MIHSLRRIRGRTSWGRCVGIAAAVAASASGYLDSSNDDLVKAVTSRLTGQFSSSQLNLHNVMPHTSSGYVNTLPAYGKQPLYGFREGSVLSPDCSNNSKSGDAGDGPKKSIVAAAAMVAPAVVIISISWRDDKSSNEVTGFGCGTIIESDGTILTCAHLLVDNHGRRNTSHGKVDVSLPDGRTFVGNILHVDAHSDIGTVKIKSKKPLPVAKLGSSRSLRPGDQVITIGCPLSLHNTVTAGIVSCLDRKSSDIGLGGMPRKYIQTDCVANTGNSGGPLVNLDGEVVGVHVMSMRNASGYSLSVPIDSAVKIMEDFKRHGKVVRPWLGLKMVDLSEKVVAQLREKDATFPNVKEGALVAVVTPRSPADAAGFCPGDVVIEINGEAVRNSSEIASLLEDTIGQEATVTVRRTADCTVLLTVTAEEAIPDL